MSTDYRHPRFWVLCAAVLVVGPTTDRLIAGQSGGAAAERDVRAVIQAMEEAVARGDLAAYERLLAKDFTAISRTGSNGSPASTLNALAAGALRIQKASTTELLEETLVIHGEQAASRTIVLRFLLPDINRDVCVKARFVFARFDEGWRLVSLQETQLHDGPIVTNRRDDVPGRYEVAPGRIFTVIRKGRTLFGTLPTAESVTVPLFETPDGGLIASGGEFAYTLQRDSEGRLIGISLQRYGRQIWRAQRVER